ncbi:hypothetical protein [Lactococcus lactis]|uniref:hypothetical protein n=1 Tax=Lactococcus lactis TaxID=1358 RepID=UPI00288FE75C|nr:hypothetical protein [Lactococcus lactis]MDT2897172.1 hypothetical protein [Lactococcus lactis]MDT2948206.1 hypothetical protein [Lactococcus lactis]MDT2969401.1 hypothetical protein [Lactococcus lactis]
MFPENKEDQEQNDINSRNNNIFANNNKKIIPPENGIGINQFPEKSDPVVKNELVSPPAYLDPLTYEATPKQVEEPILGGGQMKIYRGIIRENFYFSPSLSL